MAFQKGHIPWHKGKHIQLNTGRTHIKKGQHLSLETEFQKGMKVPKAEKNWGWKGNNASFSGIHIWVHRNWIKKEKCDGCKKIKKLDWANKDHKYNRVRKDWMCLCRSCHQLYDFKARLR